MKSTLKSLLTVTSLLVSINLFAQNAEELIEKGEFLMNNNRFQEALAMFEKASTLAPDNHLIPFEMAACYTGMTNFKKAVLSLEKAVKLKPDYSEAYELLGDLYAVQFRSPKKAAENYDLAFQYNDDIQDKVRYKLEIINILYTYDKHFLAYKHIKDAQEILPDNFDLTFFEAQYYVETEQYQKAKPILEEIIVDIPEKSGNEVYFFEMARTYFYLGEYEKAKEFFTKADRGAYRSKIPIYTPEFFLNVAQIYKSVFEYEQSEKLLNISLAIDKQGSSEAFELKTELAQIKTDKSKLIEALKSSIEREKDREQLADFYSQLAKYSYEDGNHILAEMACDEYLKLKPLNYDIMFLQALALSKMEREEEAITLLSRMKKNPKVPKAYQLKLNFGLGLVYKEANRLNEAEDAFKDAFAAPYTNGARYELMEIFKLRQRQEQEAPQE